MDIFAVDEEKNVYNTEMQEKRKTDLAQRSRFYQSMIDKAFLIQGYRITISWTRHISLWSRFLLCLAMWDIGVKGTGGFSSLSEHTTDENAENAGSERIRRIHDPVCKVKRSEEVGVKHMQAWEEKYYERQEEREEGRKETRAEMFRAHVLKLNKKGMDAEKIADLLEETPEEVRRQGIGG